MRNKRLIIFLILILIISLAQACVPPTESMKPIQTNTRSPRDNKTKTATVITLTKTPHFTPTSTLSDLEPTDVNTEESWMLNEEKSASLALLLSTLDATNSSHTATIQAPETLPSTTSPAQIVNPEPTATLRIPEPTQFAGCPNGCTYHPVGCDIKGNISFSTGEKIFHVPGGEFYDACVINPDYGEKWFCTEQEAIDNGWRKSMY